MTINIDEKFIKKLNIMKRTYFEASDRVKLYNNYNLLFLRFLSFFIFIFSIIITINPNVIYVKYLLGFTIISSVYIFIFLSSNNDNEESKTFKDSGNKIIELIDNLEADKIELDTAKKIYYCIIYYNTNREDLDRLIAKSDYYNNEKKQHYKRVLVRKLRYKFIIPVSIILGTTVLFGYLTS